MTLRGYALANGEAPSGETQCKSNVRQYPSTPLSQILRKSKNTRREVWKETFRALQVQGP